MGTPSIHIRIKGYPSLRMHLLEVPYYTYISKRGTVHSNTSRRIIYLWL